MKTKFISEVKSQAKIVKRVITLVFFFQAISSFTELYSKPVYNTRIYGPEDSVLIDREGNRYPIKKMLDNNIWMTVNLKLNISPSFCYENLDRNCEQYGRLYTWQSAREGCQLLGEGWHLPTNAEWQQLSKYYGEFPNDSVQNRKKAFRVLLSGGGAEFNAVLGGTRRISGEYARVEAHGFYWTDTENDSSTAWFGNFAKGSQSLYIQKDGEKLMAISVRCVRNAGELKK